MPVITLLCAPRDEAFGRIVASALENAGHEPHWPATAHDAGDLALDEDAAVVIWSGASLPLLPFHEPALDAQARGALVPIVIDGAPPPPGFEDLAPVNLAGWRGAEDDPRWRFVLDEIELAALRRRRNAAALSGEAIDGDIAAPVEETVEAPTITAEVIAPEAFPPEEVEPVAPKRSSRRPSRFGATAVALSGASVLVVLAAGAILIAPNFDNAAQAPAEATLGFVQPINPVTDETAPEEEAPADFEITVTRPASLDANGLASETIEDIADAIPDTELDGEPVETAPALADEASPVPAVANDSVPLTAEIVEDVVDEAEDAAPPEKFFGESPEGTPYIGIGEGDVDFPADSVAPVDLASPDPAAMERLVAEVAGVEQGAGGASANTFRDCAACPEMTAIPAGRFVMGTPVGEMARQANEGPTREVSLANDFALGAREVTFAEWDACVADGGCRAYKPYDHGWGRAARPVVNISFKDAQSYAAWLSQKTGETYRLPTETEWEYAARAGAESPFSFAGPLTAEKANYDSAYPYDGPAADARGQTTPTASFAPNAFGLYDMHGNVWEWTADCWRDNGAGADCGRRVLKGGAWNTGGWRLRAGHRIGKAAAAREFNKGFRVARELN